MRVFNGQIIELSPNQIFVFGSNEAGKHGAGAALQAMNFGAKYGKGVGKHGQTYAIPTKDKKLKVLDKEKIQEYIDDFCKYAKAVNKGNPEEKFLITNIGCGLAGYTPDDIAPMFFGKTEKNMVFSPEFAEILLQMQGLMVCIHFIEIFSNNCMEFFLKVLELFPKAELYYDNDHIICKVWNLYIDKDGIADPEGYLHWSQYGKQQFNRFELNATDRKKLDNYLCTNTQSF